jgi:hypothetical protein
MPEIVVKIPKLERKLEKELAKRIEALSRVEIVRFLLLERWNKMLSKSKLTERECIKLGRELKRGRFEKLRKAGLA